ncbi:GrpB protein [Cohnella lupini]|uniref:GrpB protein n=1 Tax=Cohnella lupini TaxID=1294267 RepID=A0A3D9IWI7_9BACL|nr:GrpB protein [Cohnella lupini]
MKDPVIIEPYNEEWPEAFTRLGGRMRQVIGQSAIRIDHIGSTAVPGLAAKPVLDIQISIVRFDEIDSVKTALEELGYRYRPENDDLTKRYFRET